MNAGNYVGRIGGLAVALGVGAAVFSGNGVACASPTASGSSSSDGGSGGAAAGSNASSGTDTTKSSTSESTSKDTKESGSGSGATSSDDATSDASDTDKGAGKKGRHGLFGGLFGHKADSGSTDEPDTDAGDSASTPGSSSDGAGETPAQSSDKNASQPKKTHWSLKPAEAKAPSASETTNVSGTSDVAEKPAPKKSLFTVKVAAPETTTTVSKVLSAASSTATTQATVGNAVTTDPVETATVARPLATFVKNLFDAFNGNTPAAPAAGGPLSWIVAAASRRELGTAAAATPDPTMVLNGYYVVATGDPLYVTSYYGMFTNWPGFQGIVQGEQDFDLVNPETNEVVGSFHGLVNKNNSLGFGQKYTEILVTEVDTNGTVGTAAGQIPPVGSVLGWVGSTGRYGKEYSAMPGDDGKGVVGYYNVTPFGAFKMWTPFDAATNLTDYTYFNRTINTADGYTLEVAEPDSAEWMAVTGWPPFFNGVQGKQIYNVKDSEGNVVGQFEGYVTVTADIIGTYTEAIYVTDTLDSTNVGTEDGDTPPVGTVYNVIFFHSDDKFSIYSAKPDPEGGPAVIRTAVVNPVRTRDIDFDFDATSPPDRDELVIPNAYTLKPLGDRDVSGINGLPPREAILQGYQQFEVYDKNGNLLGVVDANRTTQWDIYGDSSVAVLVTRIDSLADGVDEGDIPPVGSVFNINYTGNLGFGQAYYSLPGANGGRDKVVMQFVTPFGGIPMFTTYDASKDLAGYTYYSPFADQNANVLAFDAAGASAGLLGTNQMLCVLNTSCAA